MASRSRSRSPLHHEFNLGIDHTSPLSEDTMPDTDIIVPRKKKYIEGLFQIRLENIPEDWIWSNVSLYVRNHTDYVDKAIAKDITFIRVKTLHLSLRTKSWIHFQTEHLRNKAFLLLKHTKEKVNGKTIFAFKCDASSQAPQDHTDTSNDWVDPTLPHTSALSTTSNTSAFKNANTGKYHFRLSNIPLHWNCQDMSEYVKKHTDYVNKAIAEDITYYRINRGPNLLRGYISFNTEQYKNQAFSLLRKTVVQVEGKTLMPTRMKALRERSKSPMMHEYIPNNDRVSPTPVHTPAVSTTINTDATSFMSRHHGKFHLRLENVPNHWRWFRVMQYIKRHTNCVDKEIAKDIALIDIKTVILPNLQEDQIFTVHFKSHRYREQAMKLLQQTDEEVEDKKINAYIVSRVLPKPNLAPKDMFSMTHEEGETYGLNMDLLKKLKITLPLSRTVIVKFLPLDCEESNAHIVFSLAGSIESLSLQETDGYLTAIVEYEHPLEAVQAVSMFDEQEIFGSKINCNMSKHQTYMIEGFSELGPGLGPNGTPLHDIRVTLMKKKLKADILNKYNSALNSANELEILTNSLIQANEMTLALNTAQTNVTNAITTLNNLLANQGQPNIPQNTQSNTGTDSGASETLLSNIARSNMDMQTQAMKNQSPVTEPMQVDTDIQSGPNVQVRPIQDNTNTQAESNMQSVFNMQSGQGNTQKGPCYMQSGPANMQNTTQGESNMQSDFNMQKSQDNTPKGPCYMQSGPANMQKNTQDGSNMQSAFNNQSGQDNTQKGPCYMQSGPANMQNTTQGGSNMQSAFNMQKSQDNTPKGPCYMPSGPANMQNTTQGGSNMQSDFNMQKSQDNTPKGPCYMPSGPANMQNTTQGGSNMQSDFNMQKSQDNTPKEPCYMQSGPANVQNTTQGGSNMQSAFNIQKSQDNTPKGPYYMQSGSAYKQNTTQGGSNMQSAFNMQKSQDNTPKGPCYMPSGPANMQNTTQGGSNMQSAFNNQSGQDNTQKGPCYMQSGPANMQSNTQGGSNMQSGPANMQNNTQGGSNMQSAFNMQRGQDNTQKRPFNMLCGPANMQNNSNTLSSGTGNFNQKATMEGGSQMQSSFQKPYNQSPYVQGNNNFGAAQAQQGVANMQSVQQYADNTGSLGNKKPISTVLQFKNLPQSLTQPALKMKVQEVGKVKFVQMGNNGRALVHFLSAEDADQCFRLFNQTELDGQLIEVRKI